MPNICRHILSIKSDCSFIPVSDNVDPTKAGGSHWSLLLVGVSEKTLWYLDSLPSTAPDKAADCRYYAKAMTQVFGFNFELSCVPVPKQANGSDCGIHVCMETDILLARLQGTINTSQAFDPSLQGHHMDSSAYRDSLQKLIASMIEQRGRRIGSTHDIAVSPERRSSSRTRPSIDQRMHPSVPEETILE